MLQRERIWIPPWGLAAAHLAHGTSWVLLLALASQGLLTFSLPGLAWVHTVALGWLTMASLSVLVHVVPGFLDVEWRWEGMARWALLPYALGVVTMISGFWLGRTEVLAGGATVVVGALTLYLAAAARTLLGSKLEVLAQQRVRRAFYVVLTCLAIAAGFGVSMAYALLTGSGAWLLTAGPKIHAHLGGVGWLSILVFGVSVRTVRPITGGPSPYPWLHIVTSSLTVVGLVVLLVGLGLEQTTATTVGAAVLGAGMISYLLDLANVVRRARVPHRPPQAFLAAAAMNLALTTGVGVAVATGRSEWQSAYIYLGLMGWLGQMVNGHLHHIGIRVLATVCLGEEDETPPMRLLRKELSWGTWTAFQLAIWLGAAALLQLQSNLLMVAAGFGLAGWLMMTTNVAGAWRRAQRLALSTREG